MGTTCQLDYRVKGGHERETVWVVDPAHPIVQGIGGNHPLRPVLDREGSR